MDSVSPKIELDAVLDTMVDGVIMIDDRGNISRYNPACEDIFQYPKDAVLGSNIKLLMPEPYHSSHDNYIENYHRSGTAKIIGIGREVKGQRRDGSVFPMYLSVGETSQNGQTVYVGIIRDLTREQSQQAEYERLQQQHFHLSRVAAMDQMGAAIAHELNQPLTAIMNYLQAGSVILDRDNPLDKSKLSDIMAKTSSQTQRAAQILSRLRKFIETGDVEKEIIEISDTIRTAIDLTSPYINNNRIEMMVDINAQLPAVLASDIQIQQVLVNLIRNACEAMDVTHEKILTISAKQDNQSGVEILIQDTGRGMSEGEFEKLYQPFSTSKKRGLGVGLSISQTIIANHNGRLWAEKNIPQGTCFYLTLPRA